MDAAEFEACTWQWSRSGSTEWHDFEAKLQHKLNDVSQRMIEENGSSKALVELDNGNGVVDMCVRKLLLSLFSCRWICDGCGVVSEKFCMFRSEMVVVTALANAHLRHKDVVLSRTPACPQ